MRPLSLLAALILSATAACGGRETNRQTVTIYTSIYEHVIAALDPVLANTFPDVTIRWFQRGSEDVAARLNSEIAAGRVARRPRHDLGPVLVRGVEGGRSPAGVPVAARGRHPRRR